MAADAKELENAQQKYEYRNALIISASTNNQYYNYMIVVALFCILVAIF